MKQYDEIMNRIVVTDEMKIRVLENLQKSDVGIQSVNKVARYKTVKKYLSVAACFVLLLAGVLSASRFLTPEQDDSLELMNPGSGIITVSSAEELADMVGFEIEELEQLPFHVEETIYTSYGDDLGEISYIGENQSVTLRKSAGDEDNSGDYTVYDQTLNRSIGANEIEVKGDGELFYLAVWSMDGFSYSVSVENGIDEAAFTDMIGSLILAFE